MNYAVSILFYYILFYSALLHLGAPTGQWWQNPALLFLFLSLPLRQGNPFRQRKSSLLANQHRGFNTSSQSWAWTDFSPARRTQSSADCLQPVDSVCLCQSVGQQRLLISANALLSPPTNHHPSWGKSCTSRPASAGTRLVQR